MTAVDRPDNGQDEGRPGYVKAGRYWVPVEPLTFTCCGAPNPGICHQYGLCRQRGTHPSVDRAGAGEQQRERVVSAVLAHRMVAGSRRGVACLCGWSGPGAEFDEHRGNATAAELITLLGGTGMDTGMDKVAISGPLDRTQPDDDPGPQCPSTSHGTDGAVER